MWEMLSALLFVYERFFSFAIRFCLKGLFGAICSIVTVCVRQLRCQMSNVEHKKMLMFYTRGKTIKL